MEVPSLRTQLTVSGVPEGIAVELSRFEKL